MPVERTFAMLKPGVLHRRIVGDVITRIEQKGLSLVALKMMQIPTELAQTHYAEHQGKPFYESLVGYMTSGPVVAMVIEGESAISLLRAVCGATKPADALPGTIRGDYCTVTQMNVIHASDSKESADREIGLFFTDDEIHPWEDGNARWIS